MGAQAAEERVWERLAALDPREAGTRALCPFSSSIGAYVVPFFAWTVHVDPRRRTMVAACEDADRVLRGAAYVSRLAILHYLIGAKAVPPSGRLVRPSDLKTLAGQYFRGSHALPLAEAAAAYARDPAAFAQASRRLGGETRRHGDAAVELHPLPRLPTTLILWRGDEEFPARADLLFDATCEEHVPADILWSVAILTLKAVLPP